MPHEIFVFDVERILVYLQKASRVAPQHQLRANTIMMIVIHFPGRFPAHDFQVIIVIFPLRASADGTLLKGFEFTMVVVVSGGR